MMMNHHNPPMIGCSATMEKLRGEKVQPKLLHVIETLTVDRIGGRTPIPVDFRLIVATNRNLEENGPAGGHSGRLVRSPEYVFDLGTTVARAPGRYSPSGGLLYKRLCWSGQTPGNGCRTTSSGSIPTIFVAGKHPGTAECRQARRLHRQNRMDPAGRLTIRCCAAAGNPAIEARRP